MSSHRASPVVVAGHCCLDVIPDLSAHEADPAQFLRPGSLVEVGPVTLAPGGAVSNTGIALRRLGVPTRLTGKIGDDLFGDALRNELTEIDPELVEGMIRAEGASTSYTVVLSPPDLDRIFFHHPGANDRFAPAEIDPDQVAEADLLHFGYPPIMKETYADGGEGLAELFRAMGERGVPVSLDMAQPDPDSPAGRVDWTGWLGTVLPETDLFAPSFEEILFMLDRERYDALREREENGSLLQAAGVQELGRLSEQIHALAGPNRAPVTAIKLGRHGLYLHTAGSSNAIDRLATRFDLDAGAWTERQLLRACFDAETIGTTGAGDTTVAGLIAGVRDGLGPEEALAGAVGTGAFSVEAPDATSGVRSWEEVQARIADGWASLAVDLELPGWDELESAALWSGPLDAA